MCKQNGADRNKTKRSESGRLALQVSLFPAAAGVDGYTYDEWLAMERLRTLRDYRGRRLQLDRAAAEERRRLAAAREGEALHGILRPSLGHDESGHRVNRKKSSRKCTC